MFFIIDPGWNVPNIKKKNLNQAWWYSPIISALEA
jgi:hypothetical protein